MITAQEAKSIKQANSKLNEVLEILSKAITKEAELGNDSLIITYANPTHPYTCLSSYRHDLARKWTGLETVDQAELLFRLIVSVSLKLKELGYDYSANISDNNTAMSLIISWK